MAWYDKINQAAGQSVPAWAKQLNQKYKKPEPIGKVITAKTTGTVKVAEPTKVGGVEVVPTVQQDFSVSVKKPALPQAEVKVINDVERTPLPKKSDGFIGEVIKTAAPILQNKFFNKVLNIGLRNLDPKKVAPEGATAFKVIEEGSAPHLEKFFKIPVVKDATKAIARETTGTSLKARVQSLSPDKTYKEAYEAIKKDQAENTNTFSEKFLSQLGDTAPQTAIGVLTSLIPVAGGSISTAYWTAISASEQMEGDGKVSSVSKLALDVIGDRMLGNSIESLLKLPSKGLFNNIVKGFGTEGGTEVAQDLGKFQVDYLNAKTEGERQAVINSVVEYIKSGQILITLGVGGITGAGISGVASIGGGKASPGQTNIVAGGQADVSVTEDKKKIEVVGQEEQAVDIPVFAKQLNEIAAKPEVVTEAPVVVKEDVIPTLPKKKEVSEPLIQEAKRYKSAEEFVKAQGENVISSGSDRITYKLGSDKVIKVAKNERGISQNKISSDTFAQDNGLIPKVYEVGKNKGYVITEFVGKPDIKVKEMVSKLKKLDVVKLVGKVGGSEAHIAEINKATKILKEYGYNGDALKKYEPLWQDLLETNNWGVTKDGKAILLDEGSLDGNLVLQTINKSESGTLKKINPKSQLKDIWNKAQKKPALPKAKPIQKKPPVAPVIKEKVKKVETPVKKSEAVVEPKKVEVSPDILPVGEGKKKVSRLEQRTTEMLEKVDRNKLENINQSTFQEMNKKENIRKASEYVTQNPNEALEVLSGDRVAPKGILTNSIFVAMNNLGAGDVALARKLASLKSTRAGQELSILTEIDPDSPVKVMSEIVAIREKVAKKRRLGREEKTIKKEMKETIKKKIKTSKFAWTNLIEEIKC